MIFCTHCMEKIEEDTELCPYCGCKVNENSVEGNCLQPQSVLHGKYIVGRVLGQGSYGITYIGYDAELERKVAIKEFLPNEFANRVPGQMNVLVYDGDKREQFLSGKEKYLEEASRLAKFHDQAGIVQIYDYFEENNTAYLIMEYLDGETLKDIVKREGKMPLESALNVLVPIFHSLKAVHEAGIIHRDIAPDNILVTKTGEAKLIDFGASRYATTGHSRSLTVLIKQGYAPVEQYNSRGDQGTWTDVYGLAATFYFLLTGKTPQDAMERKGHDMLKSPIKEGAKIGRNVDTAILNALNLDIQYRTKTVEEFENELMTSDEVSRIIEPLKREDLGKIPKWLKYTFAGGAALLGIFLILIFTGVIEFGKISSERFSMNENQTYVPGFINHLYSEAGNIAEENHVLVQIIDSIESKDVEKNMVMTQSLASGSVVKQQSTVELVVSSGPGMTAVPVLVGENLEAAIKLLKDSFLQYEIQYVDSNEVENTVVNQNLQEMSVVEKETNVIIEVSTGYFGDIDENVEVTIPNFAGMTFEEAQDILHIKGLRVKRNTEFSIDVKKGCVISQKQEEGSSLKQGDVVELNVSLGKKKVLVPYVMFKTEKEAKESLERLELVVNIDYVNSNEVKEGNVISQSLEDGTQAEAGDTIKLKVSLGPVWSDMVEQLPEGVTQNDYEIETIKVYRSSNLETTTSPDRNLENQGWTMTGTVVQNGNYGEWSEWSDSIATQSENRQVESKTLYQSRTKSENTSTTKSLDGWTYVKKGETVGNWGEYTRDVIKASDTEKNRVEVETREVTEQVQTGTLYHYYHWDIEPSYKGIGWTYDSGFAYEARLAGRTVENVPHTETTYKDESSWNSQCGGKPGFQDGKMVWWYTGNSEPIYENQTHTEYRSRTITYTYYFEKWSEWSGWSEAAVSANDTTEVQTKTQTRYRDRSKETVYAFERWSEYSEWTQTVIKSAGTVKVEEAVRYKYRQKIGK